ncbi:MAG: 4Fe-4S binding protein [Proteobacteria bacterium]|nr:4Fe-4S binding protein [Pseudomonadota bacterium]
MTEKALYEKLARHIDQGLIGSPRSPALMEILEIMFPGVEAEVALNLPMQNKSLAELQPLFPDRPDLEDILTRMARRGTVFTSRRPGRERKYRLLPSVEGWAEAPFWAGLDTPEARKLAPLWLRYRDEAFGAELARGDVPVMRVLPVSRTLRESTEVLPYNALEPMVRAQSFFAVAYCPCRRMKRYVGEGCDHSLENCLHFGSMGRYLVEQGMAREIDAEATLEILKQSHEEGLVHAVENMEGILGTICNCCGCCCAFLETMNRTGLRTMSVSNYAARVEVEACLGCGVCQDRCPMGAITLGDEDVAQVDEARCIGCGVCTPTCAGEALDLVLRSEVEPPPRPEALFTARYKGA